MMISYKNSVHVNRNLINSFIEENSEESSYEETTFVEEDY